MLDPTVIAKLEKSLDPVRVKHRQGGGGLQLAYLKGHNVIDQANECFGFGAWGYDILLVELQNVLSENGEILGGYYAARVRLTVRDCMPITEEGVCPIQEGRNPRAKIDAHDMARKGAVTDAMKRAFRCFGEQFGNSLYDTDLVDGQPKTKPKTQASSQPATTSQNRPIAAQQPAKTQNGNISLSRTTPSQVQQQARPASTPAPVIAPSPNPVATKPTLEVLGPATYGCPRCDGPVELFRGVGTTADPNEAYSGERCVSKGCGYKKKYESGNGAQLTMAAGVN